jgi:cytochrome c
MQRPGLPPDFNVLQRSADIFSWQEFMAVNWPALAGRRGEPDWNKKIADSGPRVWETWKEEYEVYLPDGQKPKSWNDPEPVPPACGGGTTKLFFRTQKIDDVVDSTVQAAAADGTLPATLTDQQGHLVRYEIRLNKVMFDYIVEHKLYNANVQTGVNSVTFPDGGILIKAAWRELTPNEEFQFHTVTACVCDKGKDGKLTNCQKKRMGLVGFHITQKTPSAPQWVWSTFEQVNNVPGHAANGPTSFNNRFCNNCPANRQSKPGTPNQLVRTAAIPSVNPNCNETQAAVDNVSLLNDDVRKALGAAGSVFQNYQLVNTQWPVPPTYLKPETAFSVRPIALANTTMESFVQPTSSCMGCHSTARTVNPNNFVSSDFSFTLNNAEPLQKNCKVIPPPTGPVTAWDRDHWTEIKRGFLVATQTYEQLPRFVPTARLHCASCHLSVGGNSDAAWWVDLKSEYPTKPDLQGRINNCFTNSLNGKALCSPAGKGLRGDCDTNPWMNGLTTYMEWLDEQAKNLKLCNTQPHGFPRIPSLIGVAANGQQTFLQKCAVCHGADGQGRYESNIYYRPALWGPHSFNTAAGMFSDKIFLAAFARWNMPLMAGGLLTDQEAWDLEAFLHSKPRPVLKKNSRAIRRKRS